MRFGRTLRRSIYPPWKDQYIDYGGLKKLLRVSGSDDSPNTDEDDKWTDDDETRFVDHLVNRELEKVHSFHAETFKKLEKKVEDCQSKLDGIADKVKPKEDGRANGDTGVADGEQEAAQGSGLSDEDKDLLREVLKELDDITMETNELEKYSRINYTGFRKIVKKHDRWRGQSYPLRPFLEVQLASLPFNKENYSPLIFRVGVMYSFARNNLEGKSQCAASAAESEVEGADYTSHKFWIDPDNLLEVKMIVLRHLPMLVYNPVESKVADGTQGDPTITSIYFDNEDFDLYDDKVANEHNASSLRLRWTGQLSDQPSIVMEKKTMKDGNASEESRFPIKEKYILPFIKGEYKMEKSVKKIQDRAGDGSEAAEKFQRNVNDIQNFISEHNLQPVLRANYTRTAFEIPRDDRVRITIDTNLALIREDALDTDRPCRDPDDWHRRDIDDDDMAWPFSRIRKGEINKFPFALMEIKTKGKKRRAWVEDLMDSHLVKEAPRFSKFVHGVATLFEDYVNTNPFWLSEVDTDIRKDPQQAFEEEQNRKAKAAEEEFAVGSLFGAAGSPAQRGSPSHRPSAQSPVGSPFAVSGRSAKDTADLAKSASLAVRSQAEEEKDSVFDEPDSDDDGPQGNLTERADFPSANLGSIFPSFSRSKFAQRKRERRVQLPEGVRDPGVWIKDQSEVKVEPKVWLANQRTLFKWFHVTGLMALLSVGLYSGAGKDNPVARTLGAIYMLITVFTGFWGWVMFYHRSRMIKARSGEDLYNIWGPLIVCVSLIVALMLNFVFKYRYMLADEHNHKDTNSTTLYFQEL